MQLILRSQIILLIAVLVLSSQCFAEPCVGGQCKSYDKKNGKVTRNCPETGGPDCQASDGRTPVCACGCRLKRGSTADKLEYETYNYCDYGNGPDGTPPSDDTGISESDFPEPLLEDEDLLQEWGQLPLSLTAPAGFIVDAT